MADSRHPLRLVGQLLAYGGFAFVIAYFSASPAYQHSDPEKAQIKISFSHAGARKEECREISPAEMAKLPPNMRQAMDCPRRRIPVVVEVTLDGALLFQGEREPTGLWRDGPSTFYERFAVDAGTHTLSARLRDSARNDGFDYEKTADIVILPRQNFVIMFKTETGGFIFE